MSKRMVVTLEVLVRVPLPAGATAKDAKAYILGALANWRGGLDPKEPMASLATRQITMKVVKRECVYL